MRVNPSTYAILSRYSEQIEYSVPLHRARQIHCLCNWLTEGLCGRTNGAGKSRIVSIFALPVLWIRSKHAAVPSPRTILIPNSDARVRQELRVHVY